MIFLVTCQYLLTKQNKTKLAASKITQVPYIENKNASCGQLCVFSVDLQT